jgi:8-oxo-dGTP pyrophosphatase MutT (NUDIX family)
MSLTNHALYQVATKALLFDDDKLLVLYTPEGYLDFPGGRVDESERDLPWTEALQREIAEEVGPDVRVDIGQTLIVSKRRFNHEGQIHHIAAIFFECHYRSGNIVISDEHHRYEWLTVPELLASTVPFVSPDEKQQLQARYDRAA